MGEPELVVERRRRRRRRLPVLTLIFLTGAAVLVGLYFYAGYRAQRRLDAAVAVAEARDPYWRLPDMEAHREVIPESQNAALVVIEAGQRLSSGWNNFTSTPAFQNIDPHSAARLNAEQVAILKRQMQAAAPALSIARKLKDLPNGRYSVVWSEDGISTLLPHLQVAREIANLLSYDALLRAQEHDLDGALESCRGVLNDARSIGDEPTYISVLVRIAIRAVALGRLESVLAQGEPSEAALAACQSAWQEEAGVPLFYLAERGERAFGDRVLLAVQDGKLNAGLLSGPGSTGLNSRNITLNNIINRFQFGSFTTNRAACLEMHNELMEITLLPEAERKPRLAEAMARAQRLPGMARLLFPAADKVSQSITRTDAHARTMVAALAAERYRKAKGKWPESLEALVPTYLKSVPMDPYDAHPLRYRKLSDGVVIYALGADEKDNNGTLGNGITPGTDLGIRLWNVENRRQAALPVKPPE